MFALPIALPRFKSIIFYQNSPKIFDRWGLRPQTPKAAPSLRILATRLFCVDADGYASESFINTIFDAGKTKRAFYVINLN